MASNGSPGTAHHNSDANATTPKKASEVWNEPTKRPRPRKKGPNYNQIHSQPLPLAVHPLPAFHPTHPLSLFQLAFTYLVHLFAPPTSHVQLCTGYFSSDTRSVHITDPTHVRALWEMGFFGKGTLSRSEPSWMAREEARRRIQRTGGRTAEEATNARREERRRFKLERAMAEREKIERQRLVEAGELDAIETKPATDDTGDSVIANEVDPIANDSNTIEDAFLLRPAALLNQRGDHAALAPEPSPPNAPNNTAPRLTNTDDDATVLDPVPNFENEEHLQLSPEEAFFLSYALGALCIHPSPHQHQPLSAPNLLQLFCHYGFFPSRSPSLPLAPDDPFLLHYVVYHHFRSLGWVVRSGIKFSVDYLLYQRGPVFAHAEFAVILWPAYSDPRWDHTTPAGQVAAAEGLPPRRLRTERDWSWLHCVNRVQSQVRKSLVVVYVEVPAIVPPFHEDVGALLKRYRVREFVVKRWLANRSRD